MEPRLITTLPELRVLCRRLTSTPPAQLPRLIPTLTKHLLRCRDALSLAQGDNSGSRADTAEAIRLVRQLQTTISAHLAGKTPQGRLTAVVLVKCAIDFGSWELLKGSHSWVRDLLAILQKRDPFATKELAIVALVKIYSLLHGYQTLVREIVTPTLPQFAKACLLLINPTPSTSGQRRRPPAWVIESVLAAFSSLIPLYPTTLRPSVTEIRELQRRYLAPTVSDGDYVPKTLQQLSCQLTATFHFTAPQNGAGEDWSKVVSWALKGAHKTADLVFRAVDETWEPSAGYGQSTQVDHMTENPSGGGEGADELPPWEGVQAGSERLSGYLTLLAALVSYPTKVSVKIPIAAYMDLIGRISMLSKSSPKQQWEAALQTRQEILKEERDELWINLPDLHCSAMRLQLTLLERLQTGMVPLIPEILDHAVRVLGSGTNIPRVKMATYGIIEHVLRLSGPTMSKATVEMLHTAIDRCCFDLMNHAGWTKSITSPDSNGIGTKKNESSANADRFTSLKPVTDITQSRQLLPEHAKAAGSLLEVLFTRLPPNLLNAHYRGILEAAAISDRNLTAMMAAILNPRTDNNVTQASILPYLTRLFPHDQSVEILRSQSRSSGTAYGGSFGISKLIEAVAERDRISPDVDNMRLESDNIAAREEATGEYAPGTAWLPDIAHDGQSEKPPAVSLLDESEKNGHVEPPAESWGLERVEASPWITSQLAIESRPEKRKNDDLGPLSHKRRVTEVDLPQSPAALKPVVLSQGGPSEADSDSDEESVHLNMEFDDDDADEDSE